MVSSKIFKILTVIILGMFTGAVGGTYNILALDSGWYKGLMTAKFVDYMESLAYDIAKRDISCFEDYFKGREEKPETQKIAMPELFDMIAGSETGAIIATSLVLPSDSDPKKPKYYASESLKWFRENVDVLYRDQQMPLGLKVVLCILSLILFGCLTEFLA